MLNLIYVPFVGIWVCAVMVAIGLLVCVTIIGIPLGVTLMALGVKMLTLKPRPKVIVNAQP